MRLILGWLLVACQLTAISCYSLKLGITRATRDTGRNRFIIGHDSVRRDEAQKRCKYNGGRLPALLTTEDVKLIKSVLNAEPNGHMFWIGGLYHQSEECLHQSFEEKCWYWDELEEGQQHYNSSIIEFTQSAQTSRPASSSATVILKGYKPMLDYDAGSAIHTYICDLAPTTLPPSATLTTETFPSSTALTTLSLTTSILTTPLNIPSTTTTKNPCECDPCKC